MFKKLEKAIVRKLFLVAFALRKEAMAYNCIKSPDTYVSVMQLIEEVFPLNTAFNLECELRRAMKEVRYV